MFLHNVSSCFFSARHFRGAKPIAALCSGAWTWQSGGMSSATPSMEIQPAVEYVYIYIYICMYMICGTLFKYICIWICIYIIYIYIVCTYYICICIHIIYTYIVYSIYIVYIYSIYMILCAMRCVLMFRTHKTGFESMGYGPIWFAFTKLQKKDRERHKKTEKDRKSQKRDRKRQKETKTDRKSSIQHMSSHVRSCCNMPANGRSTVVNGIILFNSSSSSNSNSNNNNNNRYHAKTKHNKSGQCRILSDIQPSIEHDWSFVLGAGAPHDISKEKVTTQL